MRRVTLRRRRSGAQRAVLAAFGLVVFVASGVAAGLSAYIPAAAEVATRAAIAELPRDRLVVEISAIGSEDPQEEEDAISEHLAAVWHDPPYEVYRSRVAGPRTLYAGPDGPQDADEEAGAITRALLVAYQSLPDHADLVEGRWPGGADESEPLPAAAHARSARELGIGAGDLVSVVRFGEPVAIRVTGLYLPREPNSRYWFGEQREIDGSSTAEGLVLALDDADLSRTVPTSNVGAKITNRWRVSPVLSELRPEHHAMLEPAVTRLSGRLNSDARLAHSQVRVDDRLSGVVEEIGERFQAARSVAAVPLVLLALAGLASLGLVGRLLATVREPETSLLLSRGATAGLLARWTVREAVPVVVLPAALGGAAAWLLLRQLPEVGTVVSPLAVAAGAAAAACVGVATLTVNGVRAGRTAVQTTVARRAEQTRSRAAVHAGTGLVVVLVSAVALWQLRSYGGLTVADESGSSRVDPIAVVASAAALLAAGVLTAMVIPGLAWAATRLAARRRDLAGTLAIRHIARRPNAYAVPVILVAMAAGWASLAAGFAGTWAGLQADVAVQRTGADLQVVLPQRGTETGQVDLQPFRDIPGVERVRPVTLVQRASVGDGTVALLAGPSANGGSGPGIELSRRAESFHFEFEAAVHAEMDSEQRRTASAISGLPIPETPSAAPVVTTVWIADADGVVTGLRPDPVEVPPDGQRAVYRVGAELPAGTPPWRVVGVEWNVTPPIPADLPLPVWSYDYDITVTSLRTGAGEGEAATDIEWAMEVRGAAAETPSSRMSVEQAPSGAGFRLDSGGLGWAGMTTVRLIPGGPGAGPVPVVATEAALDRFGLAVGDQATLRLLGTELPVRVADQVAVVPGTSTAEVIVADLGDLHAALLSAGARLPPVSQIRIDATDEVLADGSAAAATAAVAGPDAEVLDRVAIERELRGDEFGAVAVATFWIVAALSVLLAGAGVAAAAATHARQRAAEVPVLRSLGCGPDQQAGYRFRELALITVPAIVLGAGAGWLVTQVTAGLLAGAATPGLLGVFQPVIRVAVGPVAACLGALAVVCLAVAAGYAARLRTTSSARAAGDGVR